MSASAAAAGSAGKKLPKIELVPPPLWQRKRLAQWMSEWEMELGFNKQEAIAESTEGATTGTGSTKLPRKLPGDLVRPYDREPLVAGQIRLLSPRVLPGIDWPVYIAVLSKPKSKRCLVAPFSPFTVPAIPSELATGRDERFLRVLSLWNYQTTSTEIAGMSWNFDNLGTKLLADAWAVYQRFATKLPLLKRLMERIGPPLSHPLDPRYEYLAATDLDTPFAAAESAHAATLKALAAASARRGAVLAAQAAVRKQLGAKSGK